MNKKVLKEEKGMALILVIIVLLVFTIMFAGAVYVSTRNVVNTVDNRDYALVYYKAESGINYVVDSIYGEADLVAATPSISQNQFAAVLDTFVATKHDINGVWKVLIGDISADVTVVPVGSVSVGERKYKITSTALDNDLQRTLETFITVGVQAKGFSVPTAISIIGEYTESDLDIGKGVLNVDKCEVTLTDPDYKDFTGEISIGAICSVSGLDKWTVNYVEHSDSNPTFPTIKMPDLDPLKVGAVTQTTANAGSFNYSDPNKPEQVYVVGDLTLAGNLDVGDNTVKFIVTNKLDISAGFQLVGNGKVLFYVEKTAIFTPFDKSSGLVIGKETEPNPTPNRIIVFFYGTNTEKNWDIVTDRANNVKLHMSMMGDKITIDPKNNFRLNGNFISPYGYFDTKNNLENAETYLIYIPYGTYIGKNNVIIKGALVAGTIDVGNGFNLTYDIGAYDNLEGVFESPVFTLQPESGDSNFGVKINKTQQDPVVEK